MTIDELVNKYYENLNDSDLYIWNYISKNKSKTCNYTIDSIYPFVSTSPRDFHAQ